jgi:predicted dinucleotide-binding enzyme
MIEDVGIVGVGNVGRALGERLAEVGIRVRFGARGEKDRAPLAAIVSRGSNASITSVEDASRAPVVFVAVPSSALDAAIAGMGPLDGTIVVDCTNPVGPGITLASPPEGSNAARIARLAPRARVVKGWNGFGAEFHRDPRLGATAADVLLASDDAEAKRALTELGTRAGFSMLDVGPLANAHLCEAQALLWVYLAMKGGKGREVAWKLLSR